MKIPNKFKIFGQSWKIELVDLIDDDSDCEGRTYYDLNLIRLRSNKPHEYLEEVWLHEITHVALNILGLNKLNKDESKVDLIAHCFHQIFQTSEYGKTKKKK